MCSEHTTVLLKETVEALEVKPDGVYVDMTLGRGGHSSLILSKLSFKGKLIGIDLPNFVELEVVDTPPGEKGNTAQGGTKPATLETGAVVQVPFFINNGEMIRIDTRTNSYLDRA